MREFADGLAVLDDMIADLARHDAAAAGEHRTRAADLARNGRTAHEAGDQLDWHRANQMLADQIAEARRALPGGGEPPPVSPVQLRQYLIEEVDKLRDDVTHHAAGGTEAVRDDGERYLRELDAVRGEIDRVDVAGGEAASRSLAGIYQSRLRPLTSRVRGWQDRDDEIAVRRAD